MALSSGERVLVTVALATVAALLAFLVARRRAPRKKLGGSAVARTASSNATAAAPAAPPAPASGPSSDPKLAKPTTMVPPATGGAPVPRIMFDDGLEEEDEHLTRVNEKSGTFATAKIAYDEDALVDEPTGARPFFVLAASAHSDKGLRRKRNEDRVLSLDRQGLFAVADGMGGHRGGELASTIAVDTLRQAFESADRHVDPDCGLPRRAAELLHAIGVANGAILAQTKEHPELRGMGTTLSAARFVAQKQRVYIAHVGDSRVYRLRGGKLTCMTKDHTMEELGVAGEEAGNLSRALGVWPRVPVDIVFAKPVPNDVYLICSDGLTKMVADERIAELLARNAALDATADALVKAANDSGGKDNISVVLVKVEGAPRRFLAGALT